MAYTGNEGAVSAPGRAPGSTGLGVGRITGFLLIAAAVLTVAMFWLPVLTFEGNRTWDVYAWKSESHGGGIRFLDVVSAVPYVLMVIVAGVIGVLLAVGVGARRGVLFWAAAFASGLTLQIATSDVVGTALSFGDGDAAPGSGFWVITLVMLVAIAALVTGLRDAVVSKRGVAQDSGVAADRVAGVFLVVAAVVDFGASFVPLVGDHSLFVTIWSMGDGSAPWPAIEYVVQWIAVIAVAIALLAGAGVRNPAVRAAGGAAAALIAATGIGGLSIAFSIMGLNFWEYAGPGFWLAVLTILLSFGATVAGLVAQLARPRPQGPARGYAPGFMPASGPVPGAMQAGPVAPGPNPFAAATPAPNPFAPATSAPNPISSGPNPLVAYPSVVNPFAPAQTGPEVETTVRIDPEPAAVLPPRMARVYDGKDGEGRPVVDRPELDGNSRTAVLAYLESAPIVLAARSFDQDEFAPAERDVPLNFRTDGVWVWAGAVAHYLHKHGLTPEPELVQHIVSRGFRVGTVDEAAKDAAIKVITGG